MVTPLNEFSAHAVGGVPYPMRLLPVDDPDKPFAHAFVLPDGQLVYLETEEGWPVRRLGQGLYELVDLPGFLLTSNDPAAP